MVVGVGIDLEQVQRFQRMMRRSPHLVDQVYSREEQRVFQAQADPIVHFAAAFAVKEAMFKALGQGWLESELFWSDIELLTPLHTASPLVRLRGGAQARLERLGGGPIVASLSHGGALVVAQIIILSAAAAERGGRYHVDHSAHHT